MEKWQGVHVEVQLPEMPLEYCGPNYEAECRAQCEQIIQQIMRHVDFVGDAEIKEGWSSWELVRKVEALEARVVELKEALEKAAEEDEHEAWNWAQSSDMHVRENTFEEWRAAHPSDMRKALKKDGGGSEGASHWSGLPSR